MKFLFVFIISVNTFAFVDPNSSHSGLVELEAALHFQTRGIKPDFEEKQVEKSNFKQLILGDEKSRVDDQFSISPYFKDRVEFWFDIYTQYSSNTTVIHDLDNLKLVYKILDFSQLDKDIIHRFTKAKIKSVLVKENLDKVSNALKRLSKGRWKRLNSYELEVLKKVQSTSQVPKSLRARRAFFDKLAKNLRSQTGQRDFIYGGILRSLPYQNFLQEQLKNFKLPPEVLAISFLESSFNPRAISKVDASGVWQFMPYIGNLLMPKSSKYIDYRESPAISTLAAFHLLKQNKMILKRWDLAVTAYNSGTRHLVRARRMFSQVENFDLAFVFENYQSKHLGFASVNFYAEFLALVHVLAYKESIYPLTGHESRDQNLIKIYISKCLFGPKSTESLYAKDDLNIELNLHLNGPKKVYGKHILLGSSVELSPKYYYKLSNSQLAKVFPKNYYKFSKNEKCGKL